MRFLFLEPFFGGSHRDFARGLVAHSRHTIDLVTLPARFWKWRMRGAALHFVKTIDRIADYDGILASGLMSMADFTALCGGRRPPALVYFHESQLTYPLAPGARMDVHFGFTDITTALSADRVLFNSRFHRDHFLSALPQFIDRMPEFRPRWVAQSILGKSGVRYPGCDFDAGGAPPSPLASGPPLVIWNHRWEFDKNPDLFFTALAHVRNRGVDFRLAVLGENFQAKPRAFVDARSRFGEQIVQFGFVESKSDYLKWLKRGFVVVSTAIQENFGIAVIEAMRQGCLPLLPDRLAYPEILPREFHADHLYRTDAELVDKLAAMLQDPGRYHGQRPRIAAAMTRHAWPAVIDGFDRELAALVSCRAH